MAYSFAPPINPGQESLAQTQASVLQAVTTNPVSSPAPISVEAAKVGIFSNPTFPTPVQDNTGASIGAAGGAVVNPQIEPVPNANTTTNPFAGAGAAAPQVTQLAPGDTPGPSVVNNPNSGSSYTGGVGNATNNNTPELTSPSKDWRVKLTLANGANYLYEAKDAGILEPLKETKGVIFPYTPSININYSASYDSSDITHSNYKIFQYKNSSVGDISITADFTAQDTREANYLLAVIHFFRSATKMFYGNDQNPPNGVPPPLLYLSGFGQYQFDQHPVLITNFSYHLPADVDYIKAGVIEYGAEPSQDKKSPQVVAAPENVFTKAKSFLSSVLRLQSAGLKPGANSNDPRWKTNKVVTPTYVPTKISLTLQLIPVVSRRDISTRFSLQGYANGKLYSGSRSNAKGMW